MVIVMVHDDDELSSLLIQCSEVEFLIVSEFSNQHGFEGLRSLVLYVGFENDKAYILTASSYCKNQKPFWNISLHKEE